VVRTLEATRARAFRTGDTALLHEVYAPSSPALAADLATLHRLVAHHLHEEGFTMTTLRVDVVTVGAQQATLRVRDEVSAYTVSDGRTVTHVAATGSRTLTMRLLQGSRMWRISEIHG